jgi:hypothetical protein
MLATHDAKPALVRRVDGLGHVAGFRLKETLAVAIRRFGPPSHEQHAATACQVMWSALDLQGTFVPGGDGAACSRAGRATSLRAGATWSTPSGLHVGSPETTLRRLYPRSTPLQSGPGSPYSYYPLVPTRPTTSRTNLQAEVSHGRVDALIVTAPSR